VSPAKSRKPYINPLRQTRHTGECISQPKWQASTISCNLQGSF
jgi:hypothetical protein